VDAYSSADGYTDRDGETVMTLRQKQSMFVLLVARLIQHASANGYELTFGETYRSPEEAARLAALGKGIAASLHTQRLAIDLNLFLNGVYLTSTESHRPLGEWWEQQHELCRWGGRFKDGNHYSIAHAGKQ
jgi:hypothetical protein